MAWSLPESLHGIRFGLSSAVVSAVVLSIALRPWLRFRITLVASLLTIALVDSLADAYALWNAQSINSAVLSLVTKVAVCGGLAYAAARAKWRLFSSLLAAFVVAQFVSVAVLDKDDGKLRAPSESLPDLALVGAIFAVAVALSLLLNRLVNRLVGEEGGSARTL
jgi:hypothetical protein